MDIVGEISQPVNLNDAAQNLQIKKTSREILHWLLA